MLKAEGLNHCQWGVSLVELMVGITVSLILLTSVLTVILRVTVTGSESVAATRLNQQLRGGLDLMARDIQRAGYINWSGRHAWEWGTDGPVSNPYVEDNDGITPVYNILDFYQAAVPRINEFGWVQLFAFATPGNASGAVSPCTSDCHCILYSYDIDGDGGLSSDRFEKFGFRWNDGAVEMRTAGNSHTCNSGTWQDITDNTVTITRMGFSLVYVSDESAGDSTVYPFVNINPGAPKTSCTPGAGAINDDKCLWRRKIEITLEGILSGDDAVTMSLRTDVKIRNDYLQTKP